MALLNFSDGASVCKQLMEAFYCKKGYSQKTLRWPFLSVYKVHRQEKI